MENANVTISIFKENESVINSDFTTYILTATFLQQLHKFKILFHMYISLVIVLISHNMYVCIKLYVMIVLYSDAAFSIENGKYVYLCKMFTSYINYTLICDMMKVAQELM